MARILVTGSTDGLGREVARALAERGDAVVVHGRDRAKVAAVAGEVGAADGLVADLAELAQVRRLAEEARGVDVLVNNAGVIVPQRRLSADGIELTLAVNHLAPFLLTLAIEPPRTVNVASIAQRAPDFSDLMLERSYEPYDAYAQSKLCQIMFTFELAERRPDLVVNALHPATRMDTKMVRDNLGPARSTVAEGVEATVRVVDATTSGDYFNGLRRARADQVAYDPAARRELWAVSEALARR